jgi:hypothetical protein
VWIAHEEALEMEMDQIKAILSVMGITFNGCLEIEYNSGKIRFPGGPGHMLPIINFIIR